MCARAVTDANEEGTGEVGYQPLSTARENAVTRVERRSKQLDTRQQQIRRDFPNKKVDVCSQIASHLRKEGAGDRCEVHSSGRGTSRVEESGVEGQGYVAYQIITALYSE